MTALESTRTTRALRPGSERPAASRRSFPAHRLRYRLCCSGLRQRPRWASKFIQSVDV